MGEKVGRGLIAFLVAAFCGLRMGEVLALTWRDVDFARRPGFLVDQKPLDLGPIRVIPFLVDHSAFDAESPDLHPLLFHRGGYRDLVAES